MCMKYNNKISMIPNPSDPTGLYSKYARNHSMKSKSLTHSSPVRPRTLKPIQPARKRSITSDSFSKQESRDQRERRYQRDEPPPVGQYNPNQRERPKLVWDILKAYQQESHRKSSTNMESHITQPKSQQKMSPLGPTQKQLQAMVTNNPQHMLSTGDSLMSSKTSQCMVNMSRMTGRKETIKESDSWEERNGDVLQSLAYVKGTITKNIDFDKMQSHPSKSGSRINPATNYSFDYKVLKQRKSAMVDFSFIKGRQEKPKKEPTYAYQHYQYDNYVWDKNSRVYPNTKTHLIEFKRQTNRYHIPQ